MEQKKYVSVTRYGHKSTIGLLEVGDRIVIQEKIDGANASFIRDGDKIRVFSRNTELGEHNTLGGFFEWVLENIDISLLVPNKLYFGEWTNPHKVKYPEHTKQFFLFDIYDHDTETWHDYSYVQSEAGLLGLEMVPVFYIGDYRSFDHLMSFVGRTDLGGKLGDLETGEGIVVKKLEDNNVFVKLVVDQFREVQKQKAPKDPQRVATQEQLFVNDTVTPARIEKMLFKLVDEGILDENFGIEDMGTILKNMNQRIVEDILKEESESLPEDYDPKQLSKSVARKVAPAVKKIIIERGGA